MAGGESVLWGRSSSGECGVDFGAFGENLIVKDTIFGRFSGNEFQIRMRYWSPADRGKIPSALSDLQADGDSIGKGVFTGDQADDISKWVIGSRGFRQKDQVHLRSSHR